MNELVNLPRSLTGDGLLITVRTGLCTAGLLLVSLCSGQQNSAADEPSKALQPGGASAALAVLQQSLLETIEVAGESVVAISQVPPPSAAEISPRELDPFGLDLPQQLGRSHAEEPSDLDFVPEEFGTGVVISLPGGVADRLVLTNYHVVRGGPIDGAPLGAEQQRLYVHLSGGLGTYARIVAADPRSDLAILILEQNPGWSSSSIKPIPLGTQSDYRRGELVLVLGNPYAIARDGSASASLGMISNIARFPAADGPRIAPDRSIHQLGTLLTVDARLSLGTSGGALVNLEGELIGLTTSLAALQGYEKTVGYAIPLDAAIRRVIGDLSRGYEVNYAFLGIEPRDALPHELANLRQASQDFQQKSAAIVRTVTQRSPAGKSGIRPDDVIVSVNGQPIRNHIDVHREVGLLEAGAQARVQVLRFENGRLRELNLTVELGKWSVEDNAAIVATRNRYAPWRGIQVDFPTARRRWINNPLQYPEAVVVTHVAPEHPLGEKLKPGDFVRAINGTPVQTPAQFYAAAQRIAGDATLELLDGTRLTVSP